MQHYGDNASYFPFTTDDSLKIMFHNNEISLHCGLYYKEILYNIQSFIEKFQVLKVQKDKGYI
jgi:hypothetical protein